MGLLDLLAERRIAAALEAGAFDDLPGQGRPLDLRDDPLVPEDLRVAYRILRNAGYLPAELDEQREAIELRALLATIEDDGERRRAAARLALLELRREAAGTHAGLPAAYRGALLAKLAR